MSMMMMMIMMVVVIPMMSKVMLIIWIIVMMMRKRRRRGNDHLKDVKKVVWYVNDADVIIVMMIKTAHFITFLSY